MATSTVLPSVSVGARRGNKPIPRLPLSAFTPPNSGTGEKFPLPPSPTTVHPDFVFDAAVTVASVSDLEGWRAATGPTLSKRISGVVISANTAADAQSILSSLGSSPAPVPVLSVSLPLPESDSQFQYSGPTPITYRTEFRKGDPNLVPRVKAALNTSVVELDVTGDLVAEDTWERLEEFLGLVLEETESSSIKKNIVLSNLLPPPKSLEISTVKLLNHPSYLAYQAHIATLSFYVPVYMKYVPPLWGNTPGTGESEIATAKEWKRRLKMYLGPIVEAFGFNRIIFGSSPSPSGSVTAKTEDWYELAREAVAELGIDQEGVDAIFGGNAKAVYGTSD